MILMKYEIMHSWVRISSAIWQDLTFPTTDGTTYNVSVLINYTTAEHISPTLMHN
jgi:hypothetical protein